MHRIVARFLVILIICSSMVDLHDLSKMAMLINHYREHVAASRVSAANGEVTLAEFIDLHYGAQAEQHDKEHGHESLPFKSHESASTHHISAFFEFRLQPVPEAPIVVSQESLYHSHFTPGFSRAIFQPPKAIV